MPQQNPKPPIAPTLSIVAGCAIIFGSVLLTLESPNLHLGVAVAIGAVLGLPFIVLGLHLHERSTPADGTSKQFWPTRAEGRRVFWGAVALVTLFASIFGPFALVIAIGYFLPSGDNWGIVTIRLLFAAISFLGWYWWFKFAFKTLPNWFRGRLSEETIDAITRHEQTEQPKSAVAAARKNWQLLVIALVALCIALGIIDFDSPSLDINVGSKRTRGLVRLIQWCRGNPNTVTSSAVIVGVVASAWYVFQIHRATVTPKAGPPDSQHEIKTG